MKTKLRESVVMAPASQQVDAITGFFESLACRGVFKTCRLVVVGLVIMVFKFGMKLKGIVLKGW